MSPLHERLPPLRAEGANDAAAGEDAARQIDERAHPRGKGDVFELADFDEAEIESGSGDETALHAARRADKQHLRSVAGHQLTRHGQRRNDVAAGAAAGNENAELCQCPALQMDDFS